MRVSVFVLMVVSLACSARRSPAELTIESFATGVVCDTSRVADAGGDGRAWREVRGDGFTYCVPDDWRPIGARAQRWQSPAVEFSWGEPHEAFERATPTFRPSIAQPHFGFRAVTESIGGRTLRLFIAEPGAGSAFRTAAEWLEPSLELYGTANTGDGGRDILAVFRSMRFTKR